MSRETILQELSADFVRKMRNWARSGNDGGLYAMTGAYDGFRYDRSPESREPVIGGEALDVDEALRKVPNRERQAVRLFWEYEDTSMSWLGRRMDVSYHTAEVRVRLGHQLVQAELRAIRVRAEAYAEAARAAMRA